MEVFVWHFRYKCFLGSKKEKVGGNPACPRPTPDWQKPIGSFFIPVVKMPEEVCC